MSRVRTIAAVGAATVVMATVAVATVVILTGRPDGPVYGLPLDVAPDSFAATAIAVDASVTPSQRLVLAQITAQPLAHWIAGPSDRVEADVRATVAGAAERNAIAVLVAYAIPDRDCGGHSAGSATEASGYARWIDAFVAGLGTATAIVIIEPDALAQLDCLDTRAREARLADLRYAVDALVDQGSFVYLDAGHSGWIAPSEMADRLASAGVGQARGFSLNVSNFNSTDEELAYGEKITEQLGSAAHFVIDTSRNGRPSDDSEWCNPPNRALGEVPTTRTDSPLADAYLWIKTPGRSDGPCNGGPAAGVWWSDYAIELVLNARRE